jgi:hypothetical protein
MAGNALCTMHKDGLMHNNFAHSLARLAIVEPYSNGLLSFPLYCFSTLKPDM